MVKASSSSRKAKACKKNKINNVKVEKVEESPEELPTVDELKEKYEKYMTIKDTPREMKVLFRYEHGNYNIEVSFECEEVPQMDDELDELEYDDELDDAFDHDDNFQRTGRGARRLLKHEDDEEDEDESPPEYEVEVKITKSGSDESFVLHCTASWDELEIEQIQHVLATDKDNIKSPYAGPLFEELEEPVQKALETYAKERKLDGELGTFICAYAEEKRHQEYVNFLSRASEFLM